MIEFKNVSLRIKQTKILEDISFIIEPKEMVALVGPSGAGKSSIFSLLTAEKKPSEGEILVQGVKLNDLTSGSIQSYRRSIGVIFQDFRLIDHLTVAENILYALKVCGGNDDMWKVESLLDLVNLSHRANNFPHELSGGEKQRTSIARSLINEPKLLIADEATGNLDPENSQEIAHIFKRLNQENGITVFFSTHDPLMLKALQPRCLKIEGGILA